MALFPWTNNNLRQPDEQIPYSRPKFKTKPVQPNTPMPATELFGPPPDRVSPRVGRGTPADKAPDPFLGTERIPASRYTSRDFMTLEWERMWSQVWLMACRESDIAKPGTVVPFQIGRDTILILRQWDDSIRAFYNVCQHRGSRLLPTDGSQNPTQVSSLKCGFHHWEWDLDGSLRSVPDPETFPQGIPCNDLALNEVRCAKWGGWVFICLDPEVESLEEYLENLPEHLNCYRFENLVHQIDRTVTWPCNWKTAMDIFSETYHVQAVHPQLMGWTEDYHVQIDTYGRHSRMLVPFYQPSTRNPDQTSLSPDIANQLANMGILARDFEGRPAAARRALQKAKRAIEDRAIHLPYRNLNDEQLTDNYHYTVFPNVAMNIFADYTLMMRMRPHEADPNQCYCDVQILVYQDPGNTKKRPVHTVHHEADVSLGDVIDQDAARLREVQAGLRSGGFPGLFLGEQERRIRHFHQVLMAYVDFDPAWDGEAALEQTDQPSTGPMGPAADPAYRPAPTPPQQPPVGGPPPSGGPYAAAVPGTPPGGQAAQQPPEGTDPAHPGFTGTIPGGFLPSDS
ncbi:MAG: SRPBCC family protein [Alphaproteobacteria bacterium]